MQALYFIRFNETVYTPFGSTPSCWVRCTLARLHRTSRGGGISAQVLPLARYRRLAAYERARRPLRRVCELDAQRYACACQVRLMVAAPDTPINKKGHPLQSAHKKPKPPKVLSTSGGVSSTTKLLDIIIPQGMYIIRFNETVYHQQQSCWISSTAGGISSPGIDFVKILSPAAYEQARRSLRRVCELDARRYACACPFA